MATNRNTRVQPKAPNIFQDEELKQQSPATGKPQKAKKPFMSKGISFLVAGAVLSLILLFGGYVLVVKVLAPAVSDFRIQCVKFEEKGYNEETAFVSLQGEDTTRSMCWSGHMLIGTADAASQQQAKWQAAVNGGTWIATYKNIMSVYDSNGLVGTYVVPPSTVSSK